MLQLFGGRLKIDIPLGVNQNYSVKGATGTRAFAVYQDATNYVLGNVSPIVLVDPAFWTIQDFTSLLIPKIEEAGGRDWTGANPLEQTKGAKGLSKGDWTAIKKGEYENNECVALMVATLTWKGSYTCVVSAAANMLYDNGWHNHDATKKQGAQKGQVHAEIFLAGQLEAFLALIDKRISKDSSDNFKVATISLSAITIEADFSISKSSMCDGCQGVWKAFNPLPTYRLV